MLKPPIIKVANLDRQAITQHDHEILIEYLLGETYTHGMHHVILDFSGKRHTMIPEEVARSLVEAARDVVKCHTAGIDAVMDKFVERLADLIGES